MEPRIGFTYIACVHRIANPIIDSCKGQMENFLSGELVNHEVAISSIARKDLTTSLLEGMDGVLEAIGTPWTVPWPLETTVLAMLLCFISIPFVGGTLVPYAAHRAGLSYHSLTARGQAMYKLAGDAAQGLAGVTVLYCCLYRFRPLPGGDWFRFTLRGSWPVDVALGCLTFPAVKWLALLTQSGVRRRRVGGAAVDVVATVVREAATKVSGPLWEEMIFRGFLLPSLSKYVPVWCAVLGSSVLFAVAHGRVGAMLHGVVISMVTGLAFARTRNLLASVVLHSLWNLYVFLY